MTTCVLSYCYMCNSCMQELHAILAALCKNFRQFKSNACKNCTCNHSLTLQKSLPCTHLRERAAIPNWRDSWTFIFLVLGVRMWRVGTITKRWIWKRNLNRSKHCKTKTSGTIARGCRHPVAVTSVAVAPYFFFRLSDNERFSSYVSILHYT